MMYNINLVKQKPRKKRTAKSNGQKDYEERNSKLLNLGTSPIDNFNVSNCKNRVQSINQPTNTKKIDMGAMKSLKVASKNLKFNVRVKVDQPQPVANTEVARSHPFKLLRKSNVKSKSNNRRSLSGSNKTGRPTTGQTAQKKKLKTIKTKPLEPKGDGGYFCIPQFPNNMHAAKALLEFKKKLKKTENSDSKGDAQEMLKEYIRKFMKNSDYQKHFEPSVTKIISEYGLVNPNGEPIIENLIKLHLPLSQNEVMSTTNQSKKLNRNYNELQALLNSSKSSTNESSYHKSRAHSNDPNKQSAQLAQSYGPTNNGAITGRKKRISSQEKPSGGFGLQPNALAKNGHLSQK